MSRYNKTPEAIAKLTPEQYRVTQESGTERPGTGELLRNKGPGIYVDVVSGEPLFASTDKFESGTGWPSFTKPLVSANVAEIRDVSSASLRFVPKDEMEEQGYAEYLPQIEGLAQARRGIR